MKCSKVNGSKPSHFGPVCLWRWACGKNGNHHFTNFKNADADFQGFIFALSHAVQLTERAGAAWVASLCFELNEQYGRGSQAQTPFSNREVKFDCSQDQERTKKTEDSGNAERTCSVCMDRQVNSVLIPCGHTVCKEDALQLQRINRKCHICKEHFSSINKLYFN